VFPHGSVGEIVRHVKDLQADPARARAMGLAGHAHASSQLRWRNYAEAMVEVYRKAMAQG
jgi:hypothetical protein